MIKRVLVYTYGDQSHENTIRVAANFATAHNAKLMGLFVKPDMMGYTSVYGTSPMNLARTLYDIQDKYAAKMKEQFHSVVSGMDLSCEWHEINEFEKQPNPSAYADIIFVSQPDRESSVVFNDTDFVDQIILDNGLPVVVIPKLWDKLSFGSHPVLAWQETKEAISAVRHTMSLMRKADKVDVLTVYSKKRADKDLVDGMEICEYLAEHEINAEFFSETQVEADRGEVDAVFRHIATQANDLVIAGGYGHSRLRQIVLGGMTRSLIKRCHVPTLLAH